MTATRKKPAFRKPDDDDDTALHEEAVKAVIHRSPPTTLEIPLDLIDPNPFQARKTFQQETLNELAEAIRVQGFRARLFVRPSPKVEGRFQLLYGERRLRAAKIAGLASLTFEIAQYSDRDMVEIGLSENIQREDLLPLEEAEAIRHYMNVYGLSTREAADKLGKHRSYIDNRLSLLRLPEDVQEFVRENPTGSIVMARNLAQLPPEERAPLIEAATNKRVTAADVATVVREKDNDVSLARDSLLLSSQFTSMSSRVSSIRIIGKNQIELEDTLMELKEILGDMIDLTRPPEKSKKNSQWVAYGVLIIDKRKG